MTVIEEVKQKTDIVEVVSQYTKLTKAGRTLKGVCPFHSEKHGSFFIYPEQQTWHCFGACNTGGDLFTFIMKKENLGFGDALRLLADKAGVIIPERQDSGLAKDKKDKLLSANSATAIYYNSMLLNSNAAAKARAYLAKRDVSDSSVATFQLGYAPGGWQDLENHLKEQGYSEKGLLEAGLIVKTEEGRTHDRFHKMLTFPITDSRGKIMGFGARVLDDSQPKYLNSPQTPLFDKSSIIYGLNLAASEIRHQDKTIIVEGYMDVITAHQRGFKNVVASMGTSVTERQILILKKLSHNLVFALDSDSAGQEATLRGVEYENTLEAEVKVAIMPQGSDPDELIKKDAAKWQVLTDKAVPIMDFVFDKAAVGLDLESAGGKSKLAEKLLPIISVMKDVIRQSHYLHQLAVIVGVNERKLEDAIAKLKLRKTSVLNTSTAAKPVAHSALSSKVEEYCLSLLLKHPRLNNGSVPLQTEFFTDSRNREIFIAFNETGDSATTREKVDFSLHEHFDNLLKANTGENKFDMKLAECISRLKKLYLRRLEKQREAILASEAVEKGHTASLIKLEEQGIDVSHQLKELFLSDDKRKRQ
ncbi:MAG: DNA primase [Chloroflexi bacterium]|nr:DNA primase [Chloroflexota bacterium]